MTFFPLLQLTSIFPGKRLPMIVVVTAGIFLSVQLHSAEKDAQSDFGFGNISSANKAFSALKAIAQEGAKDPAVRHHRVQLNKSILTYDFNSPPDLGLVSPSDRQKPALDLLTRTAEVQRDLSLLFPKQDFWVVPLKRIESTVEQMVETAYHADSAEWQRKLTDYRKETENDFKSLEKDLSIYAEKNEFSMVIAKGLPAGFKVTVIVQPPAGRVRAMYFLEYKIAHRFGTPLDEKWNNLTPGAHFLQGRYHYRADWPGGPPEEGNFVIDGEKDLKFTPDK